MYGDHVGNLTVVAHNEKGHRPSMLIIYLVSMECWSLKETPKYQTLIARSLEAVWASA